MASGKIDQSLEEILKDTKSVRRGARPRRAVKNTKTAAPVGGIKKSTRPARNAAKQAPAQTVVAETESEILVEDMPADVNEALLKDYFRSFKNEIGPVKSVMKMSHGSWKVKFVRADGAKKASKMLKGLFIDKKPLKVRVLVDGDVIPEPPALKERITKAQPKSAAKDKATGKKAKPAAAAAAAAAKPAGKKGRAARPKSARPVKKTAEELDAEMADYFDAAKAADTNGAPANGGDAQMDDEIL